MGELVRTVGAVDPSDTVGEDVAGAADVAIRAVVAVGEMVAAVGAFDVGDIDTVGPVGDVVVGTGELEGAPVKHAS